MKTDPKIRNLAAIRSWGKYYLIQKKKLLLVDFRVERIREFTDELWEFLYGLRNKRLTDRRLSAATRDELDGLYDELHQLAQSLAIRVAELQRNQEIMKRLESIALPEPTEGIETRDLSTWNLWPFGYSERLRTKLATARLPE